LCHTPAGTIIAQSAHDVVPLVDRVLRRAELEPSRAGLDPQELVEMRVRLTADVLAGPEPHHRELRVLPGEQHRSERLVVQRGAFDVSDPSEHARPPVVPIAPSTSITTPDTTSRVGGHARFARPSGGG
jgi:hypothetical protein